MKRLSKSKKFRQAAFAKKRWQKRLARRKKIRGPNALPEIRVQAPKKFSLSSNYQETVSCLKRLKDYALLEQPAGTRRQQVWIDLSKVETITPAGALVLAAEMDRWRRYKHAKLAPRNVDKWDPNVRKLLDGIGFFRLLGVGSSGQPKEDGEITEFAVLPLISSDQLSGVLFEPILDLLNKAAQILGQAPWVYQALIEAAYNATLHAYPDDQPIKYPVVSKRWWATACWNIEEGVVKFLIYDQGVGIPATLPKSRYFEHIRAWLPKRFREYSSEASRLIEAALRVDRSSLKGGHGKGLQDVIAPVDKIKGSRVRILSGTGGIIYYHGVKIERRDETQHLGGTLLEWTIPVDSHLME